METLEHHQGRNVPLRSSGARVRYRPASYEHFALLEPTLERQAKQVCHLS
jgi:hypothetical protein